MKKKSYKNTTSMKKLQHIMTPTSPAPCPPDIRYINFYLPKVNLIVIAIYKTKLIFKLMQKYMVWMKG